MVYYVCWKDSGGVDQIYVKMVDLVLMLSVLVFNDCMSNNLDLVFVSGMNYLFFLLMMVGGYQFYVGDVMIGQCWSLLQFGVNVDVMKVKFGVNYYGGLVVVCMLLLQGWLVVVLVSYNVLFMLDKVFDGNMMSMCWDLLEGVGVDLQWIFVDFGVMKMISSIDLYWDVGVFVYQIQMLNDNVNWMMIYLMSNGVLYGYVMLLNFNGQGCYVWMFGMKWVMQWGYLFDEMQVWGL